MKVRTALVAIAAIAIGAARWLRRPANGRCTLCLEPIGADDQHDTWCARCWWEWQI